MTAATSPTEESSKETLSAAVHDQSDLLPRDIGEVPKTAWLLAFIGAAYKFAQFGITVVWQNYLQNPRGNSPSPGALGLGEAKATTIQNAVLLFQYVAPLPFAVMSDSWLGRYRTVLVSLLILLAGCIILFVTAMPSLLDRGAGLGGFIAAVVFIGLGSGGLSTVLYPIIADQIPETPPTVQRRKDGTLFVADRKLTIQYVYNYYYWLVNIASLSTIATTLLEKHVGFWVAYLVPTAVLAVSCVPLLIWRKEIVKRPPDSDALPNTARILLCAVRARSHLSKAKPEYQLTHHNRVVPWTAGFVDEIRRGLRGCRIIPFFVLFWLCYNQTTSNIISQAGQTEQYGLSNDTLQALNPIACIILGPVFQNLLFPFLRRRNIAFGPIRRMTAGFLFISAGIAYGAGFQALIYSRGPCFRYPLECPAAVQAPEGPGTRSPALLPNQVNVWIQTPLQFLLAAGEILAMVSLNEYIQHEAPSSTKALVRALQEQAAVVGSALGIALGVVSKNPFLTVLFASLAGAMALCAVIFFLAFRKFDRVYDNANNM